MVGPLHINTPHNYLVRTKSNESNLTTPSIVTNVVTSPDSPSSGSTGGSY